MSGCLCVVKLFQIAYLFTPIVVLFLILTKLGTHDLCTNMQKAVEQTFTILFLQEAQLSQSDRAMLCVIEYSAKSLEVTHGHSK